MATVKVIMENMESGERRVMSFSDDDIVPARLQQEAAKRDGWLPALKNGHVQTVEERDGVRHTGRPAGYRSRSAFLKSWSYVR